MESKSKQDVTMTFSPPESSTPTTGTTPEASKRYFDFKSSSCHALSHALRGLQPPPGTAAAVSCLIRGYGAREPFGMIGGMVAVNAVRGLDVMVNGLP